MQNSAAQVEPKDGAAAYREALFAGLRPPPHLTVSEWADTNRFLSRRASVEHGLWRTSRTPYLGEIMDALSAESPVESVVIIAGAQLGKSETGNNWVGYVIDHAPGPMLVVQPTLMLAKRYSQQRIAPMIAESPVLRAKVRDPRERDSGNSTLLKEFPGGVLAITGANSAISLRSMPVRYLFGDEIDAWPGDSDGEGDPVRLAERGLRTYSGRSKSLFTSTATIEGRSRIQALFDDSDRSRFWVPCPECGTFFVPRWSNIKWEGEDPSTARMACEACGGLFEETCKTAMLARGEWRAERPELSEKRRGFHITSLLSPFGWYSWAQCVEFFLATRGRPDQLRVFINTVLGETFKESVDPPPADKLHKRVSSYRRGTVPHQVVLLTAGVDVQADRLEMEVVGWGEGKRSWSIEHVVIPGDTGSDEPWQELWRSINRTFPRAKDPSIGLTIRAVAIDSADQSSKVYGFVRRCQQPGRVFAIRGFAHLPTLVGAPHKVEIKRDGKRLKRGVQLWGVGVGVAKTELYNWLRLQEPDEGAPDPEGFCRWPKETTLETFLQLTAEKLVARIVRGRSAFPERRYLWEKTRERNEALDCRVYARAAAAIVGMDRWSPEDWRALASAMGVPMPASATTAPGAPPSAQQAPPAAQAPGPAPRRPAAPRQPGWLDGYV